MALVVNAEGTLGTDGIFPMKAGKIRSIILVDEKSNPDQQAALVDFVKHSARDVVGKVQTVKRVPISLSNDHLGGQGVFKAGGLAAIETRPLKKGDCVCSNESCFYLPLANVDNSSPAYANTLSYTGYGLDSRWTLHNIRSAVLGTFAK